MDTGAQDEIADKLVKLARLVRLGIIELKSVHIEATTFDGGSFKLTTDE